MGERIPIPEDKRCTANKAGSGGEQCKNAAIKGGKVCPAHGGSATQVRAKAQERLLAMADPALTALLDIVNDKEEKVTATRLSAAKDILDRIGLGAKQQVELTVENLDSARFEDLVTTYAEGYAAAKKETKVKK